MACHYLGDGAFVYDSGQRELFPYTILLMFITPSWPFVRTVGFGEISNSCFPETRFGDQNKLFCFGSTSAIDKVNMRRE